MQTAQKLSKGECTLTEIINVIAPALKGGGNNFTPKELSQKVWKAGVIEGMRVAGEILTTALDSGQKDEGNEEAEQKSGHVTITDKPFWCTLFTFWTFLLSQR